MYVGSSSTSKEKHGDNYIQDLSSKENGQSKKNMKTIKNRRSWYISVAFTRAIIRVCLPCRRTVTPGPLFDDKDEARRLCTMRLVDPLRIRGVGVTLESAYPFHLLLHPWSPLMKLFIPGEQDWHCHYTKRHISIWEAGVISSGMEERRNNDKGRRWRQRFISSPPSPFQKLIWVSAKKVWV